MPRGTRPMRAGFGPLLQVLNDADVRLVVVGPVGRFAPASTGAASSSTTSVGPASVGAVESLDIVPAFDEVNLARLARVLDAFGATLRITGTAGGMRVPLSPALFVDLPVLPLSTRLGDVTVLHHPSDRSDVYAELLDAATEARIDGVSVLVTTDGAEPGEPYEEHAGPRPLSIPHGLRARGLVEQRSVEGGSVEQRSSEHRVVERPVEHGLVEHGLVEHGLVEHRFVEHNPVRTRDDLTGAAGGARAASPESEEELADAILEVVGRLTHPVSVRELVLAMSGSRRLPYKQVKLAAEALTARGELLREKDGSAHRYRLPADTGDRIARQIAALLRTAPDRDATLQRARGYVSPSAG